MNLNTLLSTIILVSFLVTIVLAIGSYIAYKLRESRRPRSDVSGPQDSLLFFERVFDEGSSPPVRAPSSERRE